MTALGKLGKHIKEIPALSVKDFWRQPSANPNAGQELAPELDAEEPLSPRSVQVRIEAKQAVLQVRPLRLSTSAVLLQGGVRAFFTGSVDVTFTKRF